MKEVELIGFWKTYRQRFEGIGEFLILIISIGSPLVLLTFLGLYLGGEKGAIAGAVLASLIDLGLIFPYLEYKKIY